VRGGNHLVGLFATDLTEPSKASSLAGAPRHSVTPQRKAPLTHKIYSQIDCVVVGVLVAAALTPLLIRSHPPLIPGIDFVDDSWQLDMAFKAMHHVWLGRDQVFTYGALYQAILGLVPSLQGFSLGSVYGSYLRVEFCVAVLLIYVMASLLLRRQPPWRRALYILLIAIFWWPGDSKSVLSATAFTVIAALVQGLCDSLAGVVWRAATASIIITLSFLFSTDCGVYSLAALAIATTMAFFCSLQEPLERKVLIRFGALTGALLCGAALVVNFCMSRSFFNFRFWRAALDVANAYRWTMALGIKEQSQMWLVATTAVCVLVFSIAWLRRDSHSRHMTRRSVFLQSAFLFSLLSLQTAVIRSDWEHVTVGLFPIISLTAAILLGSSEPWDGWARSYIPVYSLLILTAVFSGPFPFFEPPSLLSAKTWKNSPKDPPCPVGANFLDQACFNPGDSRKLSSVSAAVQSRVAGSDSVAVFPYENIYAVLARRRTAGGLLQHYIGTTLYSSVRQLEGLVQDKPPLLIYSMDGLATSRIDGIPSFTRTPDIWFYFQQHYAEEAEPDPGILLLRRDDSRAVKWRAKTTELIGRRQIDGLAEGLPIALGQLPSWPDHGAFLKLDLTVRYPFWWHFLKPSRLTVELELADGTRKSTVAIAEPNKETAVWVYPGDENQLRNFFSNNPADWRAAAPPIAVSRISLWLDPLDWLSARPTGIALRDVQVLQILP
jgi:hypothetical protein